MIKLKHILATAGLLAAMIAAVVMHKAA